MTPRTYDKLKIRYKELEADLECLYQENDKLRMQLSQHKDFLNIANRLLAQFELFYSLKTGGRTTVTDLGEVKTPEE